MKILYVLCAVVFIANSHVISLTLPDGSVVDKAKIKNFENDGCARYKFTTPVEIPSLLGRVAVTGVSYIKRNIHYMVLAPGQLIKTVEGEFDVHMATFEMIEGKQHLKCLVLDKPAVIHTKIGDLMAGQYDGIDFNHDQTIRHVAIYYKAVREMHMKDSIVKVTGTVVVDDKVTTGGRGNCLSFAEPEKITTPIGVFTFSEACFSGTGRWVGGRLSHAQDVKTPAGKIRATHFNLSSNGSISYVDIADSQFAVTRWGTRKVHHALSFAHDGTIEWGRFSEPFPLEFPWGTITVNGYFSITNNIYGLNLSGEQTIVTPIGPLKANYTLNLLASNSTIMECVAAENVEVSTAYGRFIHASGNNLKFGSDGKILCFKPLNDYVITTETGKITISTKYVPNVFFFPSGKISHCGVKDPVSIKTPAGSFTYHKYNGFHENGMLAFALLAKPATLKSPVGKLTVEKNVEFYDTGILKSGYLTADRIIAGKRFRKGSLLEFDDKGLLKTGLPDGH